MRSDIERKRAFGINIQETVDEDTAKEMYSPKGDLKTLNRLKELCQNVLNSGYACIIDGSFLKYEHRQEFKVVANSLNVPYFCCSCEANEDTLRKRLKRRMRQNPEPLEATLVVMHEQLQQLEPMHDEEEPYWLSMNTEHAVNWDKCRKRLGQGPTINSYH